MKRRGYLNTFGVVLAVLALSEPTTAFAQQTVPAEKPSIIFILADDVGLSDVSCCGGDHFKSPHIDALARSGTRFEMCYATPLCGPSRCQALTGRYPFRTGLINNKSGRAIHPSREVMMPTVLKEAGYVTAQAGKWGQMSLGPGEWGFDEYLSFPGDGRYWREQIEYYIHNSQRKDLPEGTYLPDVMHDFVVDFIKRHKDQPFYVYYAMSHLHFPIVRTPDSKPGTDLYADNIAYMDKLVGKLVEELDRLKLREKTLIVFTGDNGTEHHGVKWSTLGGQKIDGMKATMAEGGSRVPLIVNWLGTTPAGQVRRDLIDFSDFFPTFAELAGAKLPKGVAIDGQSFAAQIKGEKGQPRQWVYVELDGKSYVRNERWKLTNDGKQFDMRNAPFKQIAVPANSVDFEAMTARRWLEDVMVQRPIAPRGKPETKKSGMIQ